jgi:hypothetical protein
MEKYRISLIEIKRREMAYTTLIISLSISISIVLFSLLKSIAALIYIAPIFLFFALSAIILKKFFKNYLITIIVISDEFIERIGNQIKEKIYFKDIKSITIRNTTRGKVRDIIIVGKNKTIAVDGLENFKTFKEKLIDINSNVLIKESKEHIDYDHPLFYAILGILVGFIFPYVIILLANINTNWIVISISIYSLSVGLFFLINRPIAKRYGSKKKITDFIFGLLLTFAVIGIYLFSR